MENQIIPSQISECISPRIRSAVSKLQNNDICEIRIRRNLPVVIVTPSGSSFLTIAGRLTQINSEQCVIAADYEVQDTLNKCCGYSLHTHSKDISNGFITLACGARVGVCGTAVYENGALKSVRDISGLNIRIPRNVNGVSEDLINQAFKNGIKNTLIVGPPGSGKTTLIKDLAYRISDGRLGKYYKICVVDERFELSGNNTDLGPNTDVIRGFEKEKAISIAVRTMSPEIIICDEVGMDGEVDEILNGVNCGVSFVITAHSTEEDLIMNKELLKLCNLGSFNCLVFLENSRTPGKIKKVVPYSEYIKNSGHFTDDFVGNFRKYKLYQAN